MRTLLLAATAAFLMIPQAYANTTESILPTTQEAQPAVVEEAPAAVKEIPPVTAKAAHKTVQKATHKAKKAVKKTAKKKAAAVKSAKPKAASAPATTKHSMHHSKGTAKMAKNGKRVYPIEQVYINNEADTENTGMLTSNGSSPIISSTGSAIKVGE